VALARAIVFNPPVILMDEPLGALDKKLRQHLQLEIKQLQERLGATVIYVTHDQEEALTMSDRIAVLNNGKVMQLGHPKELYNRPANAFVADFLGEMNFIAGQLAEVTGDTCKVRIGDALMTARVSSETGLREGGAVRLAVRPERVNVLTEGVGKPSQDSLPGNVSHLIFNGASLALLVDLEGGQTVRADVNAQSALADLKAGAPVMVGWSATDACAYSEAA
jgi:mannopine transport system ATP-binding protein